LYQAIISLQRLATVGFTGTNGIQSHPPTQNYSNNRLLMMFMTYMILQGDMIRVRVSVLSSALACLSLPFSF